MESNTSKFRLRLNLFDAVILVLALGAAAFLLWSALKPAAPVSDDSPSSAIRYTIRFQRWPEGTVSLIGAGNDLVDTVKNYDLGQVVSTQATQTQSIQLDQTSRAYVLTDISDYEDIYVTVEATGTVTEEAVTLSSGYVLRVGGTVYLRGPGYMASGPIVSIEREG